MKVRKFKEIRLPPEFQKSSHRNKETDGVRRRKRSRSTSTSTELSITDWSKGMDQVEGALEDMYKEEVGDRSTPDNPRHPSIDTRRPAGGMGTDP
jgi:hypothetical protein